MKITIITKNFDDQTVNTQKHACRTKNFDGQTVNTQVMDVPDTG